ncbi:hypothetical protein ADL32_29545 [Streptomyces albidoflavus]|nr:hypothetical protein ADL32_29545 [Streptomyces albidoflavus]
MKVERSRRAASQSSRTGEAVSGAYWWYSRTSKPIRPLLATKQGWPSVIPVSMAWKPARASSAALGRAWASFQAAPERVEEISSR